MRYRPPAEWIERTTSDSSSTPPARFSATVPHRGDRLGKPYVPPIPGIEHADGYEEMQLDPDPSTDQRVLIIGKGNSAFETAAAILPHTAMVHLTFPVRHLHVHMHRADALLIV